MSRDPRDKADPPDHSDELAQLAEKGGQGLFAELWHFLRENKKWWLAPLIIVLVLLAVFVVLAGTGAAPFIYTIF